MESRGVGCGTRATIDGGPTLGDRVTALERRVDLILDSLETVRAIFEEILARQEKADAGE